MNNQLDRFAVNTQVQKLINNDLGYAIWSKQTQSVDMIASRTAVILTDMWDLHWSRGMTERTVKLLEPINRLCEELRERGVLIVHVPSNVASFYDGTPARQRLLDAPPIEVPNQQKINYPALPIDDSDGGNDTTNNAGAVNQIVWTRQHPDIPIDQERDVIADDEGERLYALLAARGIDTLLYTGVAVNMCILNRSFGMKNMLNWGLRCILVKDLTDSMYNPARAPYVRHDEGTQLVIDYIEKFVAPTTTSDHLKVFS